MPDSNDAVLKVVIPDAGQTRTYTLSSGVPVQFDFNTDNAIFASRNGNLEITIEGDGTVILVGYKTLVDSGSLPIFKAMGGEEVAGDVYLFAFKNRDANAEDEMETAASKYFDDPGDLAEGVDNLSQSGIIGTQTDSFATIHPQTTIADFSNQPAMGMSNVPTDPTSIVINNGDTASGDVHEDGVIIANGTLSLFDKGGDGAWSDTVNNKTTNNLGSLHLNTATGEWTYMVANADIQHLGTKTRIEKFKVYTEDGQDEQVISVAIHGSNDAPTVTVGGSGNANFIEDGYALDGVTTVGTDPVSILGGKSLVFGDVDDLPEVMTVTIQNIDFVSGDTFDVNDVNTNLFTVNVDNTTGTAIISTTHAADYEFSDLQDAVDAVTFSVAGDKVIDGNRSISITIADDERPNNALNVELVNIDIEGTNDLPNAIDYSNNEIIISSTIVDNVLNAFSEFANMSTHEVNNIKLTAISRIPSWTHAPEMDGTAYFTHNQGSYTNGKPYDYIGVGYDGDVAHGDAFSYQDWTPIEGFDQQDGILIEFTDYGKETATISINGSYISGHVELRINGTDCGTITHSSRNLVFNASDYNVESINSIELICCSPYYEDFVTYVPYFNVEGIKVDALQPVLSASSVNGDVLTNDFDIDDDVLNVTLVNGTAIDQTDGVDTNILGTYGNLHIDADGEYSYVMHNGWENLTSSVTESFQYTISDGNGGTDVATLEFPIHVEANKITEMDTNSANAMTGTDGEDLIYIADTASIVTLGEGSDTVIVNDDYINGTTQDVTITDFNTDDTMVLNDLIDQTVTFAEADNGNDLMISISDADGAEINEVVITLDNVTLNGATPIDIADHSIDISSNHESLDSLIQMIIESPEHNN